jgi:hypothetical protein
MVKEIYYILKPASEHFYLWKRCESGSLYKAQLEANAMVHDKSETIKILKAVAGDESCVALKVVSLKNSGDWKWSNIE